MIRSIIENRLIPETDYIYGFAELTGLLDKKYTEFPSGLSIGQRLDDTILDEIDTGNGPTPAYYELYNETNRNLMELASRLQNDLEILGVKSVIIEPTIPPERSNSVEYLITLTADVSHKMVATRAGLGWIGKTDLFVSKRFGPRLRLVSLLMDHPLKPAHIPITKSRCGTCTLCVDRCPAGAANGKLWDIRVRREEFFDAHKCRETCGKLARTRLNVDRRVCGICVSVCPIGKKVKK